MVLRIWPFIVCCIFICPSFSLSDERDADPLVKAAVDYYRGKASTSLVDMVIQRPDWQRNLTIKGWTKGLKDSLFYIVAPPKDQGNGTLKKGRQMWTFNPKVNRVIKLPPSMMSQAWMGSDFSNNDLAKSDSILEDYTHEIESTKIIKGVKVYVIRSIPKPDAPVVWGMQKLYIREDLIMIRQDFYDEDKLPVKQLTGTQIEMLGGKLFPKVWKMEKAGTQDEYTQLTYNELIFHKTLPGRIFTISSLKNPRR